jgi:N-acetylmuramoyl-L-alanine amidase
MAQRTKNKLAVIVGHNDTAQGAHSVAPLGQTEFGYNTKIAKAMAEYSNREMEIEVFFRQTGLGYRREIATVYAEADAFIGNDYGATIELHFNAFNGVVIGTETLSSGSVRSMAFAEEVQEELLSLLARPQSADRGVQVRGANERGGASLHSSPHPSILVDPFFGDVFTEARLAVNTGIENFAEAYVMAARAYFTMQSGRSDLRVAA